jgi:hypothetical protein
MSSECNNFSCNIQLRCSQDCYKCPILKSKPCFWCKFSIREWGSVEIIGCKVKEEVNK